MRIRIAYCVGAIVLLLTLSGARCYATTIAPVAWEQMLSSADFVGIVDCEVAGGIVAGYKVVESWKGEAQKDDIISIRIAVDYWEPQFPIALCGERYIVTAYKAQPPSRVLSTTTGSPVPLWWRKIRADYRLPLFQGTIRLSESTTEFFDSPYSDLASFRDAAIKLCGMTPEAREEELLRISCDRYIFRSEDFRGKNSAVPDLDRKLASLKSKIGKAKSVEDIICVLLTVSRQEGMGKYAVYNILRQGGREITLKVMEKLTVDDVPFETRHLKYIVDSIRERLSPPARQKSEMPPVLQELSKEKLSELRAVLNKGSQNRNFGEALDKLAVYAPQYVTEYLLSWVNPDEHWRDTDMGYFLGSYFAWKCGKDRKEHLQALTRAKDDYIRVAAAVYLTFEDAELGMEYLRKMTRLKGDPGVWAALNLVRRGEKTAMPRALEVFNSMGDRGSMTGVPHGNLQKRLLVLLSNSCKATGIRMPDIKFGSDQYRGQGAILAPREARKRNLEWWHAHKGAIIITDPWFAELSRQKID